MRSQPIAPGRFELCFPKRDTLIFVETSVRCMVLRATHDNVAGPREPSFLHELPAGGFVREEYQYCSIERLRAGSGLQWLVDSSWLTLSPALLARSRPFMLRLLAGAVLSWAFTIGLLFRLVLR